MSQTPIAPGLWWTLRAVLIRLLEAWVTRLRRPGTVPAVALLPAPTTWRFEATQVEYDPVSVPAPSARQWLAVIVVLVLALAAAWGAWRRIEILEQRHEETVSMTLAAVAQELADHRARLETIHARVTHLAAQVTAAPSSAVGDMPIEVSALKQHVEELELTIGAYGALLGKQQHEVAAHTEQLTTHDATLRALATMPRPVATTTATKARTRSARARSPVSATEADIANTPGGRPMITLPAILGAWSLGVRTPAE